MNQNANWSLNAYMKAFDAVNKIIRSIWVCSISFIAKKKFRGSYLGNSPGVKFFKKLTLPYRSAVSSLMLATMERQALRSQHSIHPLASDDFFNSIHEFRPLPSSRSPSLHHSQHSSLSPGRFLLVCVPGSRAVSF